MGNILLLFLVLFPMLLSAWVFPLRRRDRRYRNWLIQIIPAVELAAALLLLLWPGAALELPGVFGFGLRLHDADNALHRLPQRERGDVEAQLSALDFGHIQHIVDQAQQMTAGKGGHRPQLPQLLCRRRGL